MNDIYWKLVISFIVGLLIGIGSTWLYFTNGERTIVTETDVSGRVDTDGLVSGAVSSEDNWVVVDDQFPGDTVLLTAVSLSENGWVAVYEDNENEPGNILGARRFDKGEHSGVVPLLRSTEEAALYYVILHHDDGDKEFDLGKDIQLVDEEGNRIETQFQTPPHRN